MRTVKMIRHHQRMKAKVMMALRKGVKKEVS